jgi:hypothetical protein
MKIYVLSGSSSAHHQEFIHHTLGTGICHTGLKTAFEQDEVGSVLVLLESCLQTFMTDKLLLMGRGTARNMSSFLTK